MENISDQAKISHKAVFTFHLRNRSLQLTREGAGFICIVFAIGLAAINTGNNLLYLILAMCCSFIAVSGILSEMTLKELRVRAILPKTLYAREATPFTLSVANGKGKVSSHALRIRFLASPSHHYVVDREIYIFDLPAQATVEKSAMLTAARRAPLTLESCTLSTSFHFGFFIKSKSVSLNVESLVFPEIRKLELVQSASTVEDGEGIVQPRGEELYALKEFQEGDALDRVHWKSSAKAGNLRVKEFSTGGNEKFTIYLNLTDTGSGQ
ncbi:MAG: DUF58 domain-containing protein, partial [Nitrospinae bacterium]|nr:DUF58 domain-containing protein [Nitrospinota bacterium]